TSAVVSAYFGYEIRPDLPVAIALFIGALTSLIIATPLLLFELKGQRLRFVRRMRRLPLVVYFGFKVLFYLVVIVAGLVTSRLLTFPLTDDPRGLDSVCPAASGHASTFSLA